MHTDEELLGGLRRLIEQKVGWGSAAAWVNQDFIVLSGRVQQDTGESLSHVTLKRIWGKVKYEGLPQVHTLNVLARFAGFEGWRDYTVKNAAPVVVPTPVVSAMRSRLIIATVVVCCVVAALVVVAATRKKVDPRVYTFSSHTTRGAGIPNSVVFDFDARKAPDDSVIIQQSWDTRLRATVSRNDRQHTLIYYYPGFFQPKLVVSGQVVAQHNLLIPSDGWVAAVMRMPVPVYFRKEDFIAGGRMGVTPEQIRAQQIPLGPEAPALSFINVQDFGPIYADDFNFETAVRNDFHEGASVCQMTTIYLLCENTAIGIPLGTRGCSSLLNFFFTDFSVSGKRKDLSAFGVDFSGFVKVRVSASKGKAQVFVNDALAYTVEHVAMHAKIIGIDYVFQGTGSVDYARLSNAQVSFDEEF